MTRVRILVVEDSRTTRAHLVQTLSADPECSVVGEAADGDTAVRLCESLRPDVITLDMVLAGNQTGVEVTARIMAYCPTPILVVSSSFNRGEVVRTFTALAAGAVEVIEKPTGREAAGSWERNFVRTVKLVARIKVITHPRLRRRERGELRVEPQSLAPAPVTPRPPPPEAPLARAGRRELIVIGASTGGPGAALEILRHAPPAPVLLVIHIGKPFALGLVEWLASTLAQPVSEAIDGQPLPPRGVASVLVAPADRHLVLAQGRLRLTDAPERNSCRPSIDVLFESVAGALGARAVGCLLTGMGRDGAEGLLRMRQSGAATIAQDQSTCVVYGMPQEAIRLGAADQVLRLSDIGPELAQLVRGS
jgi:two-component system chemotaxis response regulator CheB